MNYTSTRDNSRQVTAQEAIVQGISPEGGLFVPETVPALTGEDLQALAKMTYTQRAPPVPRRMGRRWCSGRCGSSPGF